MIILLYGEYIIGTYYNGHGANIYDWLKFTFNDIYIFINKDVYMYFLGCVLFFVRIRLLYVFISDRKFESRFQK